MGRKLQYDGTSDFVILNVGEDWAGRLATPLATKIVFSPENNHIVDSDEVGLSDVAIELLLEDPAYRDVTDMERIPATQWQKMWGGIVEKEDGTFEAAPLVEGPVNGRTDLATGLSTAADPNEVAAELARQEAAAAEQALEAEGTVEGTGDQNPDAQGEKKEDEPKAEDKGDGTKPELAKGAKKAATNP